MTQSTGETETKEQREARAFREMRRRLRLLHTEMAGRRKDWAEHSDPCGAARAVVYQTAMSSINSILGDADRIVEHGR
jgi:hypothetical protein